MTSGGVGVMTDGRAVMVGARSGSPRGKNGPSPVLPNGQPPGLLMHPPQGEGRRGEKGEVELWEMDARRQLGVLSSNNGLVKDGQRSVRSVIC